MFGEAREAQRLGRPYCFKRITLPKLWRMDNGERARVEAGRWRRRKLLSNPGKRCLVAWIRLVVEREEVVRQGVLIDGM